MYSFTSEGIFFLSTSLVVRIRRDLSEGQRDLTATKSRVTRAEVDAAKIVITTSSRLSMEKVPF